MLLLIYEVADTVYFST